MFPHEHVSLSKRVWLLWWRVAWFVVPYTLSAYLWYLGAVHTSPARLTSVYYSAGVFAYIFEVWILGAAWKWKKGLAVGLSLVGVSAMTVIEEFNMISISENRSMMWLGDLLALGSAMMTGLVEVLYKKYLVPHDASGVPHLLLANFITGLIGLSTLTLLFPVIPLFHFTGWESFVWPTKTQWYYMSVNACFGVIYNASFLPVIALSGPVTAAVGVTLSVPSVLLADFIIFDTLHVEIVLTILKKRKQDSIYFVIKISR